MSLFPEHLQRWLVSTPGGTDNPDMFPLLPGQTLLTGKAPMWSTRIATSTSGRERRQSNWSYPRWRIRAKYEVLRDRPSQPELARLYAFFCLHAGQRLPFTFFDPYDNLVDQELLGVGDGTRTQFQLTRRMGIGPIYFHEPIRRTLERTVFLDAAETTAYTVDDMGMLTFTSAPAAGVAVTWSGQFLFLCRFNQDEIDPEQMTRDLWSLEGGIELLTVKR